LEHFRRADFSGLFLIMRGMTTHPESLGENDGRTVSAPSQIGRESRGSIRIQHVVAVARKPVDAVRLAPGCEWTGLMTIERCAQSDLIVLKNKYCRNVENGCHIYPFMKRRCFGGTVPDPGERDGPLAALLEGKGDAGKHRRERTDLARRSNHTMGHAADVKIL